MMLIKRSALKLNGYSLLEVLIVLGLISILSLLALPRYTTHLTLTHRLEAKLSLLQLADKLEQYYAEHRSYSGASLALLKMPEFIAQNNYQLVIAKQNSRHFELLAIPQNQQQQRDTYCGTLGLDSTGGRKINGSAGVLDCW